MQLITLSEANASLDPDLYPEWDLIDDVFKNNHIDHASAYTALNWFDETGIVDFSDVTTITAEIKNVIAKYADADRGALLYPDCASTTVPKARTSKKTLKVGSLESTIVYAQSSQGGGCDSLINLNDELKYLGLTPISTQGRLVRT